jgi:hypothetical protein
LVDICLDLAPGYRRQGAALDEALDEVWAKLPWPYGFVTAAAATAAAAPLTGPTALLRAGRLASWVAKYSSSVQSLCIPQGAWQEALHCSWAPDLLGICEALMPPQRGPGAGVALPYLVNLQLPVLGLRNNSAFLEALGSCSGLTRLVLSNAGYWETCRSSEAASDMPSDGEQQYSGMPSDDGEQQYSDMPPDDGEQQYSDMPSDEGEQYSDTPSNEEQQYSDMDLLTMSLATLTSLRVLHLELGRGQGDGLVPLLRALPPSLEDMCLDMFLPCWASIPLSCITHLVNLRCWEHPAVSLVLDDCSSSSRGSNDSGGGGSSSSSGGTCGAAALTALTQLSLYDDNTSGDSIWLQLPNLRAIDLERADTAAWEQIHGMQQLQQLTVWTSDGGRPLRDGAEATFPEHCAQLLGEMTQLRQLVLIDCTFWGMGGWQLPLSQPWVAAVARLTGLSALQLPATVMLVGGATMLAPLTQLEALTVVCAPPMPSEFYPEEEEDAKYPGEHARDWAEAAACARGVVQAVAAAVSGGTGQLQLQQLVLVMYETIWEHAEWPERAQRLREDAMTALPGLTVEVQRDYDPE